MKGIGPLIVAVIGLVLLISILTGGYIFLAGKSANILRTARETAIINGVNYMEFLKDSLAQSLTYSSYQALYTLSANGGYQKASDAPKAYNSIPYWRIYDDTTGYPSLWGTNLEKLTLGYLNEYVAKLKSAQVTIPEYTLSIIFGQDIIVKALSTGKLQYSSCQDFELANNICQGFTLTDNPAISQTIKTYIHNLFENAKANYIDKDPIQLAIIAAKNNLPNSCTTQTSSYCQTDTNPPTCDSLYPSACSVSFKNSINQNLLALQSSDTIQTGINIVDTKTSYTKDISQTSSEDVSCGCAQTTIACDSNGQNCATVCAHYYKRTTLSCTFSNYAASKVLVSLTDTQNKYPVYDSNDKTTDMRNAKLQFYVISGNDYSDQTKNLIP